MTKGGRIFGGIFTLIGGGINLLVAWVSFILAVFGVIDEITFYLTLVLGILVIFCGILMLADKTAGAVIALLIAIFAIIGGGFVTLDMLGLGIGPLVIHVWVEPVMILVGSIAGLAAGSE